MKILLFNFLFVLFTVNASYCQPKFDNDSTFKPHFSDFVQTIDSSFQLEKNADFELRFWTLIDKTMERKIFILSLKDNVWKARLFKKTSFQKDTLIEIPIAQFNLDKLWKSLNKKGLLNIPAENDLRDRNGKIIDDRIRHGISYRFELMTKNHKRSYRYNCPKKFSEDYKYIKAYRNVVDIIILIYNHCLLKLNIC